MWEVYLVFCMIGGPKCVQIQDSWGPHKTEQRCQVRLQEMRSEPIVGKVATLRLLEANRMYSAIIIRTECRLAKAA